MKKHLCLLLFCMAAILAEAKYEGSYLHDVTMEVETPHFDWGKKLSAGPIKTYIVALRSGARDIVELMQRLELDADIVTINFNPHGGDGGYAVSDAYENAIEGTTKEEKKDELLKKFSPDRELYILAGCGMTNLPPELQAKIAMSVKKGAGLVAVVSRRTSAVYPKMPLPEKNQQTLHLHHLPSLSLFLSQTL